MPSRSRPLVATAVVVATVATTLAGCGGRAVPRSASAADTVAIGVALNPERPGMGAILDGVELAVAELNADSAVRARGLVFIAHGTPRGVTSAVLAAERLRDDPRVAGVVGDAESGRTLDALPIYEDVNGDGARAVVAVSPTATSASLAGRSPWLFRLSPNDQTASRAVAAFAVDSIGATQAAVVYRNDSYGRDWASTFARALRSRDGSVVARDPYVARVTEWQAYAQYLATLEPEVVLFPGSAEDAGPFLRALRAAGVRAPVVGGDAVAPMADSAQFAGLHYAVAFEASRATTPEARRFVEAFTARFGHAPGGRAALAYEAAQLIGRASTAVGPDAPRRRAEVRDWIATLGRTQPPLPGIAGPIAFDDRHDVVGRSVVVAVVAGTPAPLPAARAVVRPAAHPLRRPVARSVVRADRPAIAPPVRRRAASGPIRPTVPMAPGARR